MGVGQVAEKKERKRRTARGEKRNGKTFGGDPSKKKTKHYTTLKKQEKKARFTKLSACAGEKCWLGAKKGTLQKKKRKKPV